MAEHNVDLVILPRLHNAEIHNFDDSLALFAVSKSKHESHKRKS